MSRFVNRQALDQITLANGDHVQVRQRLDAGEEAELRARLFRLEYDGASGTVKPVDQDWHHMQIALVKSWVVSWDFTDDHGQAVSYTPDLVDHLDSATVQEVAEAINALEKARKDQAAKKGS